MQIFTYDAAEPCHTRQGLVPLQAARCVYSNQGAVIMKMLKVLVLFALVAFVSGCGAYASSPVFGGLYSDVHGPVQAGDPGVEATKEGEACASSYLGIIGAGDASIHSAKEDGGIADVASVDHHTTSILGLIAEYCTVVRGE